LEEKKSSSILDIVGISVSNPITSMSSRNFLFLLRCKRLYSFLFHPVLLFLTVYSHLLVPQGFVTWSRGRSHLIMMKNNGKNSNHLLLGRSQIVRRRERGREKQRNPSLDSLLPPPPLPCGEEEQ
jgi:hypothetical protein